MISNIIQKAKVKLLLKNPFFATILLKRQIQLDDSVDTACTDGDTIWCSSVFFSTLTLLEAIGVLCHEVLHIALLHHVRIGNRDEEKWNFACDYAINPILINLGFTLPKGCLYNPALKGMSAEIIYNLLEEDYAENPVLLYDKTKADKPALVLLGGVKMHENRDKKSIDEQITRVKKDVQSAMHIARMRGNLPAGLQRLLLELESSTMDWKSVLADHLTLCTKSDYSYRKLDPSYLSRDLFVPTLHTVEKGKFILAADTSASVYDELLKDFAPHVASILELSGDELTLLYCDTQICGVQEIDPNNPEPLAIKGNGGTDFKPVGQYIDSNGLSPEILIYFTDGLCDSFPEPPHYPVIWATNNPGFNPPYGINLVVSSLK